MAEHVSTLEEGRSAFKILTDKFAGKDPQEGFGVDEREMLECILNNRYQYVELDWFGS